MRISDWSSDVCSSDLIAEQMLHIFVTERRRRRHRLATRSLDRARNGGLEFPQTAVAGDRSRPGSHELEAVVLDRIVRRGDHDAAIDAILKRREIDFLGAAQAKVEHFRSEEHTSEIQSLMSISYADF